jgi:3',5'-nucleoside bisphosphate phosphatase
LIDLHLHTSASDGLLAPAELVRCAAAAGLTTISITDHDTTAGLAEARDAARQCGVRIVPGIEITAIENGRDVHILGYFIDDGSEALAAFLRDQRADRVRRVREMAARLQALGFAIEVEALLAAGPGSSRSVGRPAIADALVAAGHASDRNDAFARLLGRGQPAFVPRRGVSGGAVIGIIHAAGGLASLAHPGVAADDALIAPLADAGLDAIEVWHSDHTADHERHYGELADRLNLARSGGSDYHGDGGHRACQLGAVTLPEPEFARLEARTASR